MSDNITKSMERIGDWPTYLPKITPPNKNPRPLAEIDPAEQTPLMHDMFVKKRRRAGLPDYPPGSRGNPREE